ncbi:MAG: radical SAM protein [Chloroflexi bacterium]|nr:radical SAM protein [Chloroflexota bacterium]
MLTVTETMPAPLRAIYEEVSRLQPKRSNLDAFRPTWEAHVSKARRQIPAIHIEAEGEIMYLGDLSPGCQACKEGAWDCIFTTMRCNLDCPFCYSPHAIPKDYAGSVFGTTPEHIAENHARTHVTGISFSGGEPFVDTPGLFAWVAWFTSRWPDNYYWVYTNGLLAHEENLRRLAELGVDEIRFNMAATGYDHPVVMRNLAAAARFIPNLTIEIPAIPEQGAKLLSCLEEWSALGVRFLNLHELIYEPGTNSASMAGARRAIITADGHRSEINPESRALTLAVMKKVQNESLPLSVNDCSMQSKIRQLRGRRRSLAPLVRQPHEKLVGDEAYESCCAYRGEDMRFFHPDSLHEMRQRYSDYRFVRLVRSAPLSLQDSGRWIAFEAL